MWRRLGVLTCAGCLALAGCDEGWEDDLDFLDTYFVKLSPEGEETLALVEELSADYGFEPIHVFERATEGFNVPLTEDLAKEVEALPEVEYVELDLPDRRVPDEDDDLFEDLEPILGDDEVPESIARVGGPFLSSVDGCHVAVLDTGIDAGHVELDVTGEIDVVAQAGGTPAPGADPQGHGTHVAGTIAAKVDGDGVAGVAPGFPLHNVRVLDENGMGSWADIIAGLEYVFDHPEICVVNLSLGGPVDMTAPQPMREALERLEAAGVLVVSAAGNSASDTRDFAPAGYGVGLVVSAYDASGGTDNGFASFTNYGDAVNIAAPGVDVLSTWPGGDFASLNGTSMAAPAVAGAAAVYMTLQPEASPSQVQDAVIHHAEHGYPGQTDANGQHPEPLLDAAALFGAAGG